MNKTFNERFLSVDAFAYALLNQLILEKEFSLKLLYEIEGLLKDKKEEDQK